MQRLPSERSLGENLNSFPDGQIHQPAPRPPNASGSDFVCITCKRGPPYTKKYAKN